MKNVISLGKLIRLLLSSLPILVLLSVNVHTKNTRNEFARLVIGTIFLFIFRYGDILDLTFGDLYMLIN